MIHDKHGQTLVLFVILIPIFLLVFALIVDTGLVISKKVEITEVTKKALKTNFDNEEAIKSNIKRNNINIDNLEIDKKDNTINIKNQVEIDSIFGNIIGIKNYQVKIDITGIKELEKIIIE